MSDTPRFVAELIAAAPLALQAPPLDRVDCNTSVHVHAGRTYAFVSFHVPIGHAYRRIGPAAGSTGDVGLAGLGTPQAVRLLDDPDPTVGKWIEATWRAPDGRLYGWYHAEERVENSTAPFAPHIGALRSDDDGLSWQVLGEVLRAPPDQLDRMAGNGFMAGGFGDFSVVPDRDGRYFHMLFSSYVADQSAQGVCAARCPIALRDTPRFEVWSSGAWRSAGDALPTPLWPVVRSWHETYPDAFWGPAVHFNRDLGVHVMLLNHTAGPYSGFHSAANAVSFNATLDDPAAWSAPLRIVEGGGWYPQVVGLGATDGDTLAGAEARLFISGLSAWHIRFRQARDAADVPLPTKLPRPDMIALGESLGAKGA